MVKPNFWQGSANDVSFQEEASKQAGISARPQDGLPPGQNLGVQLSLPKCTAQPSDLSRHTERDQTICADNSACPESRRG